MPELPAWSGFSRLSRLGVRRTHRRLYRRLMANAVGEIALALNFFWYTPTFEPFGIDKRIPAVVFLALGVALLAFVNLVHDLRRVRFTLGSSIFVMLAWAAGNLQQGLQGKASFQLPIFIVIVGIWQVFLIGEVPAERGARRA